MRGVSIRKRQRGFALLEALVTLLVFSLGMLGMIAFQASSVKTLSDNRSRTEASLLADDLIAVMAVSNPVTRAGLYSAGGAELDNWSKNRLRSLGSNLPNGIATVTINAGAVADTQLATVVITWKTPGDKGVSGSYQTSALLF